MGLDDKFEKMQLVVKAAQDEMIMAVQFHETWKPTAYDKNLHHRMGTSYATHSFQIIRQSLRREMLLALMRIWDSNKQSIRMTVISDNLREQIIFNYVVNKRAVDMRITSIDVMDSRNNDTAAENADHSLFMMSEIRKILEPQRDAIVKLIQKYSQSGSGHDTFKKLRTLRDERLAHRQTTPINAPLADTTDKEIESFYKDTLELTTLLMSLILAIGIDFNEVARVCCHHAKYFWVNARGEHTIGHPNYRLPNKGMGQS